MQRGNPTGVVLLCLLGLLITMPVSGQLSDRDVNPPSTQLGGQRGNNNGLTQRPRPVTQIDETSPINGTGNVALTRETILYFSRGVDPNTVDVTSVYATFGGSLLDVNLHISPDRKRVTLFYFDDLPAASLVRVTVDGFRLVDGEGLLVDADGDGIPGGIGTLDFETVALAPVFNTSVCGRVFATEFGPGGVVNMPLEGVKISIDGASDSMFTFTNFRGEFCLDPVPAGMFFVHIDGRTVPTAMVGGVRVPTSFPEGPYYPNVGKAWEAQAGTQTNLGEVYLPLIPEDTLVVVSDTTDTVLEFDPADIANNPDLDGIQVIVPPNSLFSNDGTFGGMVGISAVDPDRLPGELPPNFVLRDVLTVQTDGPTNFNIPVPVCLPNLPDPDTGFLLPPGAKTALWSFNHDTGRFEVVGPMTVTPDGMLACTDPGVGIEAPGWHGPQLPPQGPPPPPPPPPPCPPGQQPNPGQAVCLADCLEEAALCKTASLVGFFVCRAFPAPPFSCLLAYEAAVALCVANLAVCTSRCERCIPAGGVVAGGPPPPPMDPVADEILDLLGQVRDLMYPFGIMDQTAPPTVVTQAIDLLAQADALAGGDAAQYLMDYALELELDAATFGETEGNAPAYPILFRADIMRPNGVLIVRGETEPLGQYDLFVPGDSTVQRIEFYDPSTDQYGVITPNLRAGAVYEFPRFWLQPVDLGFPEDSDADGLPDVVESVIGTNPGDPDTDNDLILDGAEVDQGTDPLDGIACVNGIIAAADTPGNAVDICAVDNLVVVADSTSGVSVFSVFNGMDPLIIAQVDTPGTAEAVVCANTLVGVADGAEGFAVIDISDPPASQIVRTVQPGLLGGSAISAANAGSLAFVGTNLGQIAAVDMSTGSVLETTSAGSPVLALALEGDNLYALTSGTVHVLTFLDAPLEIVGSTSAPGSNLPGGLFVGGDFAYATFSSGYNTIDVSDPSAPVFLAGTPNALINGFREFATNGSGTGVAAGPGLNLGSADVAIFDTSDPAVTDNFLLAFPTPGGARAVSIFNGLAYIADSSFGLQVVNILDCDVFGVPPTVSFTTNAMGTDVVEGSQLLINVQVDDDVQVRNVELLVDDIVFGTDGNYPFQFFLSVPLLSEAGSIGLSVRATDNGGNSTTTVQEVLNIVPDTIPPTVSPIFPEPAAETPNGLLEFQPISVRFSEPMDESTFTSTSVVLTWEGPDGALDTLDDVFVPVGLSSVLEGSRLTVSPNATFVGAHRLTLRGAEITDLPGNLLDGDDDGSAGGDFVLDFEVVDTPYTKFWLVDADGAWSDATNWSGNEIPSASDVVLIDRPAGVFTVTVTQGLQACAALVCSENLTLAGGTLGVVGDLEVTGDFRLQGGRLRDATVVNTGIIVQAVTSSTLDGVQLDADLSILEDNGTKTVTVLNGLDLNGTVSMNGGFNSDDTQLLFPGVQTLTSSLGTGVVFLNANNGTSGEAFLRSDAGGHLTIDTGVLVRGRGIVGRFDSMLTNLGTIRADVSGQIVDVCGQGWTSSGTLDATGGGRLRLQDSWTSSGALTATAGGILDLNGSWMNNGSIATDASTVIFDGNYSLADFGTYSIVGGSTFLQGTFDNSDSLDLSTSTTSWQLDGVTVVGGTLFGGSLSTNSNSTLDGVKLDADLLILESDGTKTVTVLNGLDLNGMITMTGGIGADDTELLFPGVQTLSSSLGTGVVFLNANDGNSGEAFLRSDAGGSLTIDAGVLVRGRGLVGRPDAMLTNLGTVRADVLNRAIDIFGQNWTSSGALEATANAMLRLSNSGTCSGTLLIDDSADVIAIDLAFTATSNVDVELGGTAVTQHSTLAVIGAVTLDGTLNVSQVSGFTPTLGDTFDVITFSSASGTFDTVNGLGTQLQVNYLADVVQIEAIQ